MNDRGAKAEEVVVNYLKRLSYKILARNYHSRFGEIDIIAQKDEFIVFFEVKARKTGSLVGGLESVDRRKIEKIRKTAEMYLSENAPSLQPRFDVVEVKLSGKDVFIRNHIENAF